MAITYFPFDAGAGASVLESQWRQMAARWTADGVIPGQLNLFESFGDSSGMNAKVKSGQAFIQGHFVQSDAQATVTLDASNPTNPRIDLIILRANFVANTIVLDKLTGTPAATPVPPSLTQTASAWEIPLARVAVAAAASTITAANVSDSRLWARPTGGNQSFNVLDFGARGDGVTDDVTAFNNAITAAKFSGRQAEVVVPASPWGYACATAIASADYAGTIRGPGKYSGPIFASGSNHLFALSSTGKLPILEKLHLKQSTADTSKSILSIASGDSLVARDVQFEGTNGTGSAMNWAGTTKYHQIDECDFIGGIRAVAAGSAASKSRWTGGRVEFGTASGSSIGSNWIISNVLFEASANGAGALTFNGDESIVADCTLNVNGKTTVTGLTFNAGADRNQILGGAMLGAFSNHAAFGTASNNRVADMYIDNTPVVTDSGTGNSFSWFDTAGLHIGRAAGDKVGFYGATPVVQTAAYTVTNPTTDRALNVTGDTLAQGLQVLGTLIADLKALGVLG